MIANSLSDLKAKQNAREAKKNKPKELDFRKLNKDAAKTASLRRYFK